MWNSLSMAIFPSLGMEILVKETPASAPALRAEPASTKRAKAVPMRAVACFRPFMAVPLLFVKA